MAGNAVIGALRVNLGLDTAEFQNGIKGVQNQMAGLGKIFSGLAAAGVFTAFTTGIGQAVGRIEEMRKLSAQLDRALANTGNTARTSASEVASFADEIERSTGRAAEEIMAVSTNLATFGFSRDVFFDAIELADDMAAAWGGDLKQNVEGLARALADPEKGLAMLTKRGITFTDQQKEMIASFIKANDLIGAQGVVMDALNEQVKGVAASGFSGLTKASANAWKGVEDFFEAIANGMQLNLGLELGLIGVAEALATVTNNLGTIGRAMAVAGVAFATAMGPAVWAAASTAALAFGNAARAAIIGVGQAIAANPIGAIIVALSAAVSAAFLFRDEIKQIFGVDVAGVVIEIGNKLIGVFVGSYNAVKDQWSQLPTFFSGIGKLAWNSFLETFEKDALTLELPGGIKWESGIRFNLSGMKSALNPEELGAMGEGGATFNRDYNRDYLGEMFGSVGQAATTAGGSVKGFGDLLAETTANGGQGVGQLADKVGGLNDAFAETKDVFADLWSDLRSGLAGMATGVAKAFLSTENAAQKALDAVVRGLDQIATKALDMAFNGIFDMIFGAFMGGLSGGTMGSFGFSPSTPLGFGGTKGIYGIPGLATGGRTMTAGLVEVGERGREVVALPAGAQVIRHNEVGNVGGGRMHVTVGVGTDHNGNLLPFVQQVVQDGIEVYRRTGLQQDVIATMDDPLARGNL